MENENVAYYDRNDECHEFNSVSEMLDWVKINEPENYDFICWYVFTKDDYIY